MISCFLRKNGYPRESGDSILGYEDLEASKKKWVFDDYFSFVSGSPWLWWILLSDDDELWWQWWMYIHKPVSFNSGGPFRQWWTRLFNVEFKKTPRNPVVGFVAFFYTGIRGRRNSNCRSSSGVVCMLSCLRVPHVGSSSLETSKEPPKMPDLSCHLHVTTLTNFILLFSQEPPILERATRLLMRNKIKLN